MERRAFLGVMAGSLLAAPLAAEAQQAKTIPRIGFLSSSSVDRERTRLAAFQQGLRESGYLEGKTLFIEQRYAGGQFDGNVTGVVSLAPEQGAKQLEILKEALPRVTLVGVLWDALATDQLPILDASAPKLSVQLEKVEVRPQYDLEQAFLTLKARRVGAVLVVGSPVFFRDQAKIAELAIQHRVPAGGFVGGVAGGLLLGYGVPASVPYRLAADYVDKILKGAKPGELPIQQPTKFELVINLKTSKALGLAIPQSLLLRADEVISS